MSIPVEPSSDERNESIRNYVYSCPDCSVPQTAPTYEDGPVINKCINGKCDELFVIPAHPTTPDDIVSVSDKEKAKDVREDMLGGETVEED